MRRIVIASNELGWVFARDGLEPIASKSPLLAAIAAKEYGESLRGSTALGYIIRLAPANTTSPDELITLHTEVF